MWMQGKGARFIFTQVVTKQPENQKGRHFYFLVVPFGSSTVRSVGSQIGMRVLCTYFVFSDLYDMVSPVI